MLAEPLLGEIRLFPFDFAPVGWHLCDGSELQIIQNQALYSLLGITFGGNGTTTFNLPDLRGRVPMHQGAVLFTAPRGQAGGSEGVTLSAAQMPQHTHAAIGSSAVATMAGKTPVGNVWATVSSGGATPYAPGNSNNVVSMYPAVQSVGGAAHSNMQPSMTLNYCIAMQGYYPPRP